MVRRSPFVPYDDPDLHLKAELQKKKRLKQHYTGAIIVWAFLAIILVNAIFGFCNSSSTNRAIELAKVGLGGQTFDQYITQSVEKYSHWSADTVYDQTYRDPYSQLNVERASFYQRQGYSSAPLMKPRIEVKNIRWEAKTRTGDGDKTPRNFIWVKGTATIEIFRHKKFDVNQDIKVYNEEITYGPFLIDFENKIYTVARSSGTDYEDFWNLDTPLDEWRPFP